MDSNEKAGAGAILNHKIIRRLRSGSKTVSHLAIDSSGKLVVLTYLNFEKIRERYRLAAHGDGVPADELEKVATERAKNYIEEVKEAAKRVKGLGDEHVAEVYDLGFDEAKGVDVIMQEYAPGVDLLYAVGGLKPVQAVSLFAQAAMGLSYIHKRGFLHLNIKPQRIKVDLERRPPLVKITDFGFAVPRGGLKGELGGTADYMAPEVIFEEREKIDTRADMFSLGVTMYHCLTGQRPFAHRAAAEGNRRKLKTIVEREKNVTPPSYYDGEIPAELDRVILDLLEKDPDRRANKDADVLLADFYKHWPKESSEMPLEDTSTTFGR